MDLRPNSDGVSLQQVAATVGARIQLPIHAVADRRAVDSANDVTPHSVSVYGISVDSRHVQPGDLFAALPGEHVHGAEFAEAALSAGAVALLTDALGARIAASLDTPALVTDAPRDKVGAAASHIYGNPSADLLLFAVTGTNGKTTTTWLLEAGLRGAGHVTGLVGTVETRIAGEPVASVRTTPEAPELHALLAVMRERGVTAVAIEVSSHALALGRVDGCMFDVAGFTQFGSDHLDFHQTPADYFAAKARLFTPDHATCAVVCVDTPGGQRILQTSSIPTQSLVADPPGTVETDYFETDSCETGSFETGESDEHADWMVTDTARESAGGFSFQLHGPGGIQLDAGVALPGRFNIANAALALAMLTTAKVEAAAAVQGVRECAGVPGRMEPIDAGQDFLALVDYAHTPDALTAALTSLGPVDGRLIVVMGCGGDRDPSKRFAMGQVAAQQADMVIVTDDNPRSESPRQIRDAVLVGARSVTTGSRATIEEIAGRGAAIRRAVGLARGDDVVVVAGKGHEQGQEIDGHVYPFDDRVVLRDALIARKDVGGGVATSAADPEDHRGHQEEI